MKYRKKPVVIEAIQFTSDDLSQMIEAWGESFTRGIVYQEANPRQYFKINTLEGDHIAQIGDWIIRGVKGEFYPCKPDIFEMTYEAVT